MTVRVSPRDGDQRSHQPVSAASEGGASRRSGDHRARLAHRYHSTVGPRSTTGIRSKSCTSRSAPSASGRTREFAAGAETSHSASTCPLCARAREGAADRFRCAVDRRRSARARTWPMARSSSTCGFVTRSARSRARKRATDSAGATALDASDSRERPFRDAELVRLVRARRATLTACASRTQGKRPWPPAVGSSVSLAARLG